MRLKSIVTLKESILVSLVSKNILENVTVMQMWQ